MICCQPTIKSFFNALITIIPYTAVMQANYGPTPQVEVWYWDADNNRYFVSHLSSEVVFQGNAITIDHGQLSRGVVKIR